MRKIVLLIAAVVLVCGAAAATMEKTKDSKEPTKSVAVSRGGLDCSGVVVIDCNTTLYGEDNIGWPNNVEFYSCVGWTESGGERVYELTVEANTEITATLNPISGDPDIWLLGSCEEDDCITFGDISVTYISVDGGTYYIVVDGYFWALDCIYDLTVACEEPTPPPVNDTCDGAIDLREQGMPAFVVDLCEYSNQYDPTTAGCTGGWAIGPEAVYKIDLEEGEMFEACIEPVEGFINLSLYLITDCEDPVGSCVIGDDTGNPECINYVATAAGTYYLMVDSWFGCDGGLTEVTYRTCFQGVGLVGYYPFNGSAEDHSGYGNDAEVFGATLTSDRFGNPNSAYQFDGIDDYIEIIDTCPFMLTSWTIAAWFNTNTLELKQRIVGKYEDPVDDRGNFALFVRYDDLPTRAGGGYETCPDDYDHHIFTGPIEADVWYFAVYTRDHNTGEVKIYLDDYGVVDSGVWNDEPCANYQPLVIGRSTNNDDEFSGAIDDVRIFTYAISAEEVLALYEESNPVGVDEVVTNRTGIVRCYPSPFNPQTTITFALDRPQHTEVAIYDLTGKQVAVLVDRTYAAGNHSVVWNGNNATGRAVPSGTYVVRLETESGVEARKVMLLR